MELTIVEYQVFDQSFDAEERLSGKNLDLLNPCSQVNISSEKTPHRNMLIFYHMQEISDKDLSKV